MVRGGEWDAELAEGRRNALLGLGAREGEEQRDGYRFCAAGANLFDKRGKLFFRRGAKDLGFGGDALGDAKAEFSRDQGLGEGREPIVEFCAGLATDGDGVFEACGSDEGDVRAFAFEHGVGADGGSVADVDGFTACDLAQGGEDGERGVGGGGEDFEDAEFAFGEVDAVCEGASGVDGYAQG